MIFSYFFPENRLRHFIQTFRRKHFGWNVSCMIICMKCQTFPKETVCMKYQSFVFSWKIRTYFKMSSAQIFTIYWKNRILTLGMWLKYSFSLQWFSGYEMFAWSLHEPSPLFHWFDLFYMFLAAGRSGSMVLVSFFLCWAWAWWLLAAGLSCVRWILSASPSWYACVLKGHGNARQGDVCIG